MNEMERCGDFYFRQAGRNHNGSTDRGARAPLGMKSATSAPMYTSALVKIG